MSYLLSKPGNPDAENLAFLSLFVSGSIIKLKDVLKSADSRIVFLKIDLFRSQFRKEALVRSVSVKSDSITLQFLKRQFFSGRPLKEHSSNRQPLKLNDIIKGLQSSK